MRSAPCRSPRPGDPVETSGPKGVVPLFAEMGASAVSSKFAGLAASRGAGGKLLCAKATSFDVFAPTSSLRRGPP
jgi:hypothetical protein